jgi:Domain of unknown function (DUF5916)
MARRHTGTSSWLAVLATAATATSLVAQQPAMPLPRIEGRITLDGRPDEPAWQAVPALPLTMYVPVFRGTPTQRTVIRVAYDDENVYAAGWFYDTDPSGIRINSLYRDRWNGDDAFAIYIDAFNDNRNAKWFGTTPAGIRFEQLVSDDGATLNGNWDTFWDARATVTDEGWFAEVRIPFSSLGFQSIDGVAVMGLTVTRLVSRINERVTFPAIDPRLDFRQPSAAQDVRLTGVHSARPLYATPYALTGVEQSPVLATDGSRFLDNRDVPREIGLDLRYPLSSELTLDLSANTDFAQVEADDQQVNLDRFSLFYPEKRRFFQERSEIFDFTMGNSGGRLFHSRQIGLVSGVRVPVLGGGRLVGRAGAWDVGLLDMQTRSSGAAPSENFGVARVKRSILNPYSSAGAMVTSRVSNGLRNNAYGLDATIRLFGDDYLSLRWAQTFNDNDPDSTGFMDRSQYYVNWARRATRGLSYEASTTRSGSAYNPGLGFLPRHDFTTANAIANYYIFTDSSSIFRRVYPGALAFSTFRNSDGRIESGQYAVWVEWDTKAGGNGWIEPKVFREDVLEPFLVGGVVEVPAGTYTFADLQFVLTMPAGRRLRAGIDARAGSYFDGTREQIIITPTWNISPKLEVGGDYQLTHLRFNDRDTGADIHLARLRLRAALDARASGNALIQYNSTTDRLAFNFRLRYNFAEGTDLWLVYDETLATDRLVSDTGLRDPLSASRALVLKYSHTFQF